MTVCIAARFNLTPPYVEQPTSAFVLCSDARLSEGEWGSHETGIKTQQLGYNLMGMMSGHWNQARDLGLTLEAEIGKLTSIPTDKADLVSALHSASSAFATSALCPKGTKCEILITGFMRGFPLLLKVRVAQSRAWVLSIADVDTIGEGAYAASMLLKHRKYDPLNTDLATACYLVYEAKRFSEPLDSVGEFTWLKVHMPSSPNPGQERNAHCFMDINNRGREQLEEWRSRFFLQPTIELSGQSFKRFY